MRRDRFGREFHRDPGRLIRPGEHRRQTRYTVAQVRTLLLMHQHGRADRVAFGTGGGMWGWKIDGVSRSATVDAVIRLGLAQVNGDRAVLTERGETVVRLQHASQRHDDQNRQNGRRQDRHGYNAVRAPVIVHHLQSFLACVRGFVPNR